MPTRYLPVGNYIFKVINRNTRTVVNEVIRTVLNFLFFYEKILRAQKEQKAQKTPNTPKAPKALKGTKTPRQKHKTQISE